MSSRQLKRLNKGKEPLDEESDDEPISYSKPKSNLFALLSDEELDEWTEEEEEEKSEEADVINMDEPKSSCDSTSEDSQDIDELFDEHMKLIGDAERLWYSVNMAALEEGREYRQRLGDIRGVLKKPANRLIAPRTAWPKIPAARLGFKIVRVPEDEGGDENEYKVKVSEGFLESFEYLQLLVNAADAGGLYEFVHEHPENVEGLLIMSDILRSTNVADAANTVELAIYQIEKALPAKFKWTEATLSYSEPDNRTIHLALFRHLQYMLRRGSWQAAVEIGKLLYCLDRNDPLMVILLIDYAVMQLQDIELHDSIMADLGDHPRYPFLAYTRALLRKDRQALATAIEVYPEGAQVYHKMEVEKDNYNISCFKVYFGRCAALWKSSLSIPDAIQVGKGMEEMETDFQLPIYRHAYLADIPATSLRIAYPSSTTTSLDPFPPTTDGIDYDGIGRQGRSLLNLLSNLIGRQ